jgi:2-amino-4-hydroxy-6-hydroxymethyldihydropteridine diphosphokinase
MTNTSSSAAPSITTANSRADAPGEWAFVSLGSNLGDSVEIIRRALDRLQALSDSPLLRSFLWQTTPVDCPPGSPPFLNAVAGFRPRAQETPRSLLRRLEELEAEFGPRRRTVPNQPRLLDLDLIAFGNRVVHEPGLIVPHPRAHLRRFVLRPLSEIAPGLVLPGRKKSVAQLLRALSNDERLVKIARH